MSKTTLSILTFWPVFLALVLGFSPQLPAIVISPNEHQVQEALKQGEEAAKAKIPPKDLYWRFGPQEDLKPHGFLMTKMKGLTVMSSHFALRSEKPSPQDIEQILNGSELQVSVTVFGSSPQFAVDSYVVLKQRDVLVKPQRVRSDARASRSSSWPDPPAYQAKIVASFPYGTFDPTGLTSVVVFPGEGGEINFEMNFSNIP